MGRVTRERTGPPVDQQPFDGYTSIQVPFGGVAVLQPPEARRGFDAGLGGDLPAATIEPNLPDPALTSAVEVDGPVALRTPPGAWFLSCPASPHDATISAGCLAGCLQH